MTNKIKVSLNSLVSPLHPVLVNQLAVTTLSGYLKRVLGDNVEIFNHCSQFESLTRIIASLDEEQPDIIGLSLQVGSQQQMAEFMKGIRTATTDWPKLPLVVFGNVLSTFAYRLLLEEYPDVLMVVGEGEYALEGIVRRVLQKNTDFEMIPNLAFIKDGKIIETNRQAFDLEQSGLPSFDYLKEVKARDGHVWIEAGRGCNSRCTFCSRYPVRKTQWTPIAVNKVLDTMETFHLQFGITHFRFSDDDFMGTDSPLGQPHAEEIAKGIIERRLNITFDISSRVESVYSSTASPEDNLRKEKTFELLRRAGLTQVFLGVESGADKQLKRFGKRPSVNDNLMAANKIDSWGLQAVIGFITIDFLMDFAELEENILFLRCVGAFDEDKQIFVSDPLVTLRAQEGSAYVKMLANRGLLLERDRENYMTYNALYKDHRVARVAQAIEEWHQQAFPLIYALKNRVSKLSMEKVPGPERKVLEQVLNRFKILDYEYLIEVGKFVKDGLNLEQLHEIFSTKQIDLVKELDVKLSSEAKAHSQLLRHEIIAFINKASALVQEEESLGQKRWA